MRNRVREIDLADGRSEMHDEKNPISQQVDFDSIDATVYAVHLLLYNCQIGWSINVYFLLAIIIVPH